MVFNYTNIKQPEVFKSEMGANEFVRKLNNGLAIIGSSGKELRRNYKKTNKVIPRPITGEAFGSGSNMASDTVNNKYWFVNLSSGSTLTVARMDHNGTEDFNPLVVVSDCGGGEIPACEVDSTGKLWIAYNSTTNTLRLIGLNTNGTTFFAATTIASNIQPTTITCSSLTIDTVNGRLWVAYQKNSDLDMYLIGRLTSDGSSYFTEANIGATATSINHTAVAVTSARLFVFWTEGVNLKLNLRNLDGTNISTNTEESLTDNGVVAYAASNNEVWVAYQNSGAKYKVYNSTGTVVQSSTASGNAVSGSNHRDIRIGETPLGNIIYSRSIYDKTTRVFTRTFETASVDKKTGRHNSGQNVLTIDSSGLFTPKIFNQDGGYETGETVNMDSVSFSTAPTTILIQANKTTPTNTSITADLQSFSAGKEVISNAWGLNEMWSITRDSSTGNYFGVGKDASSNNFLVKWDSNLNFVSKFNFLTSAALSAASVTTDGTHAYIVHDNASTGIQVRKHLLSDLSTVTNTSITVTASTGNLTINTFVNTINFGGNFYFVCSDNSGDIKAYLVSVATATLVKNWDNDQTSAGRDFTSRAVVSDGTNLYHLIKDGDGATNDVKMRVFKVSTAGADLANITIIDPNNRDHSPMDIASIGTDIYVTGSADLYTTPLWVIVKMPNTLASETFNVEYKEVGQLVTKYLLASGANLFVYGRNDINATFETEEIDFHQMNTTTGAKTQSNTYKTEFSDIRNSTRNVVVGETGFMTVITDGREGSIQDNFNINFTVRESDLQFGKIYSNVTTGITLGTRTSFTNTATNLRLKLNLNTTDSTVTPTIKSIAWHK